MAGICFRRQRSTQRGSRAHYNLPNGAHFSTNAYHVGQSVNLGGSGESGDLVDGLEYSRTFNRPGIALGAVDHERIAGLVVSEVDLVAHVLIAGKLRVREEVEYAVEHLLGLVVAVEDSGVEHGSLWKGADGECSDDAEVVASAPQREVEVRILGLGDSRDGAVGENDLESSVSLVAT